MADEFRHGLRRLRRTPRFSVPAILVLAIGVGANGALLSVSEALLRKPLSVARPHELVALTTYNSAGSYYGSSSAPDYDDYRKRNSVFDAILAYASVDLTLHSGDRAERVSGQIISGNYFHALETRAVRGRLIAGFGDTYWEAVLSFDFWQRRFGGDPEIVGEVIRLDRHPFTVVGITEEGLFGTEPETPADLWISIDAYAAVRPEFGKLMADRGAQYLTCIGRMRPGTDLRRAELEMRSLGAQLAQEHPESHADWTLTVHTAENGVMDPSERAELVRLLGVFGAATGLLLVIISVSIASLLLAQAMARGAEIATRLALGAPRRMLLRGFVAEYLVLTLLGGGLGLAVARALLAILSVFRPSEFLPAVQGIEFHLSWTVAVAIVLLAIFAGAISGIVPGVYMFTLDLRSELGSKATVGTPKAGRKRLWSAFVTCEVALSTVLLVGAGLAFESWRRLSAIDLGFEPRGVSLLSLDLRSAGYDEEAGLELYRSLQERLESRHGVESVSLAFTVPLGGLAFMRQFVVEGYEPNAKGWTHSVTGNVVSPGHFRTTGLPLLLGRDFDRRDSRPAPGVVIVNETLARSFWPGEEVVGKTFSLVQRGLDQPVQIVGVVRDSWHLRDRRRQHGPHFYLPLAQHYQSKVKILVKSALPVTEVSTVAAEELRRLDPDLALYDVARFSDLVDASLARERTGMALLGATSTIALLLAGLGLYATLSYLVARRTAEIGLRMALGARPAIIFGLVIRRGLVLTALGLAVGFPAAAWASRLLAALLYEVESVEPAVYGAVALLVTGLSLLASYLPARRSARINPAATLQQGS